MVVFGAGGLGRLQDQVQGAAEFVEAVLLQGRVRGNEFHFRVSLILVVSGQWPDLGVK